MNKVVIIPFIVCMMFLPLFVSPVFAANLNVTNWTNNASTLQFVNTRQNVTMLIINMTAVDGDIRVYGINISFIGDATPGNISAVRALNSTGSIIGINTTWNTTTNTIYLNFTLMDVNINAGSSYNISIVYETHRKGMSGRTIGLNITSNTSIITNDTVLNNFPINSSLLEIRDLHANASISPRMVDTNVTNQSFLYFIIPTGTDSLKNISIVTPSQYSNIQLLFVKKGDSVLESGDYTNTTTGGKINISLNSITTLNLTINFILNTNSSPVNSLAFNSTIDGGNLINIYTDVIENQTNVTTMQILNITSVTAIKSRAYLNGTDYWEFNFSINIRNITEVTTGLIQLKLSNWTDNAGNSISLTNGDATIYYATLRDSANFSTTNKFNVTNEYNISTGITKLISPNQSFNLTLRMVIPSTISIVSQDWWSAYWMLFRALP